MSEIVKFPKRKVRRGVILDRASRYSRKRYLEDEPFFMMVQEWPCFHTFSGKQLSELFDAYYEDTLTPSQTYALEFLFHMHDPSVAFDIGAALYAWNEDDMNFFMMSLNIHSDIIAQIKKGEFNDHKDLV